MGWLVGLGGGSLLGNAMLGCSGDDSVPAAAPPACGDGGCAGAPGVSGGSAGAPPGALAGAAGAPPGELPGGNLTALLVTAVSGHTCALLPGGTVSCWGDNSEGQLGDGTTIFRSSPTPVP